MPHIEECKPHCLKLRHAGSTASHGGMQAPMLDPSTLPCIGRYSQNCKHCFSQISKRIMQAENLSIHRCVTKQRPSPIAEVCMHDGAMNMCALESQWTKQAPKTGLQQQKLQQVEGQQDSFPHLTSSQMLYKSTPNLLQHRQRCGCRHLHQVCQRSDLLAQPQPRGKHRGEHGTGREGPQQVPSIDTPQQMSLPSLGSANL